jgi:hypothetical protein
VAQAPRPHDSPKKAVQLSGILVPCCGRRRFPFMLQQLWDSFVLLIPVFFLLLMIFGAGFFIGRVSKKDS